MFSYIWKSQFKWCTLKVPLKEMSFSLGQVRSIIYTSVILHQGGWGPRRPSTELNSHCPHRNSVLNTLLSALDTPIVCPVCPISPQIHLKFWNMFKRFALSVPLPRPYQNSMLGEPLFCPDCQLGLLLYENTFIPNHPNEFHQNLRQSISYNNKIFRLTDQENFKSPC